MEDSSLFLQWAVSTLQHQHPVAAGVVVDDDESRTGAAAFSSFQALCDDAEVVAPIQELMEAHGGGTSSCRSTGGDAGDGGGGIGLAVAVEEDGGWSTSPNPGRLSVGAGSCSSGTNLPLMSWDFSAASVAVQVQPNGGGMPGARSYGGGVPEMVYGSPPSTWGSARNKSAAASSAPTAAAAYAQLEHVIAERKRREKITKRFIELSAVIPKLKKVLETNPINSTARNASIDWFLGRSDGQGDDPLRRSELHQEVARKAQSPGGCRIRQQWRRQGHRRDGGSNGAGGGGHHLPVVGEEEPSAAGDRGVVLAEQQCDGEDPLRERQGGDGEGPRRGRGAPPHNHQRQCHALSGWHHDHHNNHCKDGGRLHGHGRGDHRQAQLCITPTKHQCYY